MPKMELLYQLFEDWKTDPNAPMTDFYKDGIINEPLFESCANGSKLLVVAKEPNARNHDQSGDKSFITEWDNKRAKYPFARRIGEWAYGILNNFPPYDGISDEHRFECLRRISFMNVKKSGGLGASPKDIYDLVLQKRRFIVREIEIIDPEIIILGLSFDARLLNEIFGRLDWKESGYSIFVAKYREAKVIDFYHPSSRNVAAASYSLLQNVFRSDVFNNL